MFFIFRFVNPATKMGILWELAEADLDPSAKASADDEFRTLMAGH